MGTTDSVATALARDRTIDITTTGAKTGRPHRIEIWFVRVGGRIFVTGTPRPRDWLANLRADPRLIFHLKETVAADLEAVATEITDEATRALVFDDPATSWYRDQVSRDDLVDRAPLVEITFPHLADTNQETL